MLTQDTMEGWLIEEYDYDRPRRGDIREGEILKVDERGVMVDLGLKRDGFIPRTDVDRLGEETSSSLEPGQEVKARVVRLEDAEGNLLLSMYQARFEKDWKQARELFESGEVWCGEVVDHNRGGLLVQFNNLRGFVPASHVESSGTRHVSPDERRAELETYVGQELTLKAIEVDRNQRRLILSERLAKKQLRQENMERLLNELVEGQVVRGTVSRLLRFGAFVDLGGAEGLVHISELAWQRVQHPQEVVGVGDEVDVYVLRMDHERQRIGLSLKRLQPNPWTLVDETYTLDQLVSGTVTNVVDFGAFVALDLGVEGLVHVSELADPSPSDPRELIRRGDDLVLRILRINSFKERIALSLKQVSEQERDEWLARQTDGRTPSLVSEEGETSSIEPEKLEEDTLRAEAAPVLAGQPEGEDLWISLVEDEEVAKA